MEAPALREDLRIIAGLVPVGARLLDVGCGDGALLEWLAAHKQVDGRGLERAGEKVSDCIAKGLAVIQGDAETDLSHYPLQSYDIVVLSRTLQAMHDPVLILKQIVGIGKKAIVSIPNFGYWKNRIYLGFKGRMPVTSTLTYQWYDTPNIHFCTLRDFEMLCRDLGLSIEQRICADFRGYPQHWQRGGLIPNLLSEQVVFVISAPGV